MKKFTLILALLLFPAISTAAVDMFLDIEGVEGDSIDDDHLGEIVVLGWSWGTTSSSHRRICIQDISLIKQIDSSSPILLMNQVEGVVYPNATLTVRTNGDTPIDTVVLKFRNMYISKLQTGSPGDSGINAEGFNPLIEEVQFDFDDVEYIYTPRNADGSPGTEITALIRSRRCKKK